MKLQPESKKELTRIACGTAICTAVMWVIFAALAFGGRLCGGRPRTRTGAGS